MQQPGRVLKSRASLGVVANRRCGLRRVEQVGRAVSSGAVVRGTIGGSGGVVHGLLDQGNFIVVLGGDSGLRLAQRGRQVGTVAVLDVQLREQNGADVRERARARGRVRVSRGREGLSRGGAPRRR